MRVYQGTDRGAVAVSQYFKGCYPEYRRVQAKNLRKKFRQESKRECVYDDYCADMNYHFGDYDYDADGWSFFDGFLAALDDEVVDYEEPRDIGNYDDYYDNYNYFAYYDYLGIEEDPDFNCSEYLEKEMCVEQGLAWVSGDK